MKMSRATTTVIGFLLAQGANAAACAADGSDYTYSETLTGSTTRTIATNHCPNHPTLDLNPNSAQSGSATYTIPATPEYNTGQQTDLSAVGAQIGVTFDGGMIFSAFAGPSYTLTGWSTSAAALEGMTFDACGGHSSSTSAASYHYHVSPSCLLAQLGQTSGSHSPQIGWMADGFPLYGPHGPSGTLMKTCTVTGGTFGTDICTDDCAGYWGDTSDGYMYRYYTLGPYNDGTCCEAPAKTPGGGSDYYPSTPKCLNGCCPSGVTCSMLNGVSLPTCSSATTATSTVKAVTSALSINSKASDSTNSWAACQESSLCCDSLPASNSRLVD